MRVVAVLLLASSCAAPQSAPAEEPVIEAPAEPKPPEPEVALVEVERAPPELSPVLASSFDTACGSCHDSRLKTAKPEALAIFDLADANWLLTLPEARRECTLDRLAGDTSVPKTATTDLARILEDLRES